MSGSGEPYQFEPPVLEEEAYASNDSFYGLKREHMIHFLYKWLLWKRRYIIEMNTFRNSFRKFCDLLPLTSRCFSTRFLLRSRVRTDPLWMRMQIQNGIVIQSESHSCTTRCDAMFSSIPIYKTKVIIILVFWCNCVKKLCICDRLTRHTSWESIWCRKNSTSCHNVMYNTEIIKILTLCVQIALSLRQDLNIIVSLASIGQPNMILYNPIFILCMHKKG